MKEIWIEIRELKEMLIKAKPELDLGGRTCSLSGGKQESAAWKRRRRRRRRRRERRRMERMQCDANMNRWWPPIEKPPMGTRNVYKEGKRGGERGGGRGKGGARGEEKADEEEDE